VRRAGLEHHVGRGRLPGHGYFKHLGPGLITGAADDDPSGIGTYSQVVEPNCLLGTSMAASPSVRVVVHNDAALRTARFSMSV
jgi:hypothetical protein